MSRHIDTSTHRHIDTSTHRHIDTSTQLRVPVGPDADRWTTLRDRHTVLGVVRTVTSANRLLEALDVFRGDHRVQTVFAIDDTSPFVHGVHERLATAGAQLVPWDQVASLRPHLVLTATENARLDDVTGPVVVLPHGVGFHKWVPDAFSTGQRVSGIVPRQRAIAPTMVLSHPDQARQLPESGATTKVIGDPTLERMLAGVRLAASYRSALGAGAGQRLVVLSSTWGAGSLWGSLPDLPHAMLSVLPHDEFRVALILHPNVWFGHSPWQVRSWLADALDVGLALIPPDEGWQATVCAADIVVGDHGSVTLYAAALGKPLLIGAFGDEVVPGTAMAHLGAAAVRLDTRADLRDQLELAVPVPGIADRAFIPPAGSTSRLRDLLYERMGLTPPKRTAAVRAWPAPSPQRRVPGSFVVFTDVSVPGAVTVRRYSAGDPAEKEDGSVVRHRASYDDEADHDLIAAASVVIARDGADLDELIRRHPGAIAVASGERMRLHSGPSVRFIGAGAADPMCRAAAVYALWRAGRPLSGSVLLRVGSQTVALTLDAG